MNKWIKLVGVLLLSINIFAQEGMWMPNMLSKIEDDMQRMGMTMSAEDIYGSDHTGIKDAIAIFGPGCTSEVVSPNGLLFTNHHCGYGTIQSLSSMEHNYLKDGFWAKSYEEEIPAEGLNVTFINKIIDVTDQVLQGTNDDMSTSERQSVIDKNINAIKNNTVKESYQDVNIYPFYKGNQYYLYVTTMYNDVRFVGAPPSSIGKFGADTDNWMWPRHTGDFSIFRIYADENNLPAAYSPNNKPYKPKHYLPISIDGVKEGDFSLVLGFPGSTDEYLTSYAVKSKKDARNPARVEVREAALAVLDAKMRKDEATRLKYASKFAGIANYWKYWIGESKGLDKFNAVAEKEKYEKEFMNRIAKDPALKVKYANILPQLKTLYAETEDLGVLLDYNSEIFSRNISLTSIASLINRLEGLYENNGEMVYNNVKPRFANYIKGLYEDYDAQVDQEVFASLIKLYTDKVDAKYVAPEILNALKTQSAAQYAKSLYAHSVLADGDKTLALINGDYKDLKKALSNDALYNMTMAQKEIIDTKVSAPFNEKDAKIQELMRHYMKAQMEVFPERKFYPDANFTLRASYGEVKGYSPRDGVYYKPFSYLKGVMEKYKPGDYEFDVSQKLIDLYNAKDYGQYGDNGKMPVDFMATNHITGGNSGSPVLDGAGNLLGLAFDGVWEGTMGDIYYTPETCMSIMVDARYVLFIIEKYGEAQNLIDELTIVHPKK